MSLLTGASRLPQPALHTGCRSRSRCRGEDQPALVTLTGAGPSFNIERPGKSTGFCICRIAPSFNGRTAASGAAYRGSNPWGATNENQQLTLPAISRKASAVTFSGNFWFRNMRESMAMHGNTGETTGAFFDPIVAARLPEQHCLCGRCRRLTECLLWRKKHSL